MKRKWNGLGMTVMACLLFWAVVIVLLARVLGG